MLFGSCIQHKKQFRVQIIGILEEIYSFNWPKMQLWKGDKKIGQGPPSPHLDKIQKNSYFFRESAPNLIICNGNFFVPNSFPQSTWCTSSPGETLECTCMWLCEPWTPHALGSLGSLGGTEEQLLSNWIKLPWQRPAWSRQAETGLNRSPPSRPVSNLSFCSASHLSRNLCKTLPVP